MQQIPFLDLKKITEKYQPELMQALAEVVDSGWYLRGKQTARFEKAFAAYCGTSRCVSVANGLDALTLILQAMKQLNAWTDEAEIIVPAFTFIASGEAVSRAGLHPVYCDVNEDFLIDISKIEGHITPQTRAILPVHLYGKMCDMEALHAICEKHRLKIVEDAAQAHGARRKNRRAGNCLSDAAAFSFYPGKNLGALGDAGAVVTNDEALAEYVRMLANYGAKKKYEHEVPGANSRMDELQAAVLLCKLPHLDEENERRRAIAKIYSEGIRHRDILIPYGGEVAESVFHIYPIRTSRREELMDFLAQRGIETLIHYPLPLHKQAAYAQHASESHPMGEIIARTELSLPISPVMSDEEAHYLVQTLNQFPQ